MIKEATRIQSVSRSDGESAPRDDLYIPECQRRPGQLDEPQRLIPVKTLSPRRPSGQDHRNQMSHLHSLTLLQPRFKLLILSGQRRMTQFRQTISLSK